MKWRTAAGADISGTVGTGIPGHAFAVAAKVSLTARRAAVGPEHAGSK